MAAGFSSVLAAKLREAYLVRRKPCTVMEMKATPSVMVKIWSLAGTTSGRLATSTIERAPLMPPRTATFFQLFLNLSPATALRSRMAWTDAKRATVTARKASSIGTSPTMSSFTLVLRPM